MGTSLRTLAKLTNPAMVHWWKKRGIWLQWVGVGCLAPYAALRFVYHFAPNMYWSISNLELLNNIAVLFLLTANVCLALCVVFLTKTSIDACTEVENENATPYGIIPLSHIYTLALLRTWPALIAFFLYAIPIQLYPAFGNIIQQHIDDSPGLLIGILCGNIEWIGAVLLLVMWLIAIQTTSPKTPWLAPLWIIFVVTVPLLFKFSKEIFGEIAMLRGIEHCYGHLNTNKHVVELSIVGIMLLFLIIYIFKKRFTRLAVYSSLIMLVSSLLNASQHCFPGVNPEFGIPEIRTFLGGFAQLAEGMIKLPFYSITDHNVVGNQMLSSIYTSQTISLPPSLSFLSLLLNIIWLAALYFFISRVLLREPQPRADG